MFGKRENSNSKNKKKSELNEKQKRFVEEYLRSGNASEAARNAGYSAKTAGESAAQLLKNIKVQSAIEARLKDLESERVATTQEIQEYLTAVMRGELDEEVVVNVGTGKGYSRAEKIKAQVGAKDRTKAAELLAKVRGMFINKSELEVTGNLPIVIKDDL